MPQPFPASIERHNVDLTDAAAKRPMLAVRAAEVIANWTVLDGLMGALFAQMAGSDPGRAAAMYESIRSDSGRRDAFRAVAGVHIVDARDRHILDFLIERFITASTARNTIAHHLWGTQAELPDALLFMEPSAMRLSTVELRVAAALPDERAKLERMTALLDRIRRMSTVWVEQDFLDATARLRRLQVVAITFGIVIAPDGDPIESANARRIILDKNAEAAEFVRRREEKEA